jgi:hypothetical protein
VLSALMHHLDHDTQVTTAAEALRVLHSVDFSGHLRGTHGLLARRFAKSGSVSNSGDGIPRLLTAAGLEGAEVSSHHHRIMGRIAYYRAVRPV